MEARQTLRGTAAPKGLIVVLALSTAVALAVAGSVISKDLAGSGAATQTSSVHAAPGTVLRQDAGGSPALIDRAAEGQAAPVLVHGTRTSGTQSIEDNGQADAHGPDSDLTRALPSEAASENSGIGLARGNRYI